MECKSPHTKFQPTEEQWRCPKCGVDNSDGKFYIDNNLGDLECELLHKDDYIKCENCQSEFTGDQVSKLIKKKLDLVPCPCCKGSGFVKREI